MRRVRFTPGEDRMVPKFWRQGRTPGHPPRHIRRHHALRTRHPRHPGRGVGSLAAGRRPPGARAVEGQEPAVLPRRHPARRARAAHARVLVRAQRALPVLPFRRRRHLVRRGRFRVGRETGQDEGARHAPHDRPGQPHAAAAGPLARRTARAGGVRHLPSRAGAAEIAADHALRDRQEGRRRRRGRALPRTARRRHDVGALQLRRVGNQRAGAAALRGQGLRLRDRDPRDQRRVLPEVRGDRLSARRAAPPARGEGSGAGVLPPHPREGARSPAGEAADRRAREMKRARLWLAVWGGWTALALFFAVSSSLTYKSTGRPANWALSFERSLSEWWLWALLTPLVVWLARRFPVQRGVAARNGALHVLFAIVIAAAKTAADRVVFAMITGFWMYLLATTLALNMVIYGAIVTAAHGVEYYRRSREREQLEAQLAETRLQMLSMQLQPHFLFNTLNTIAEMVHEDPEVADTMIAGLSGLLRRTLDLQSAQEIPLAEEIDLMSHYLDIQRARFGERLRVTVTVSEAASEARVPGLVLQPIVENAIHHGLAARLDAGRIDVDARVEGDALVICVTDDGAADGDTINGAERVGI